MVKSIINQTDDEINLNVYCKHCYKQAPCDDVVNKKCFSFHVFIFVFVPQHVTSDHTFLYKACLF